jgi:type III secretion protein C
MVDATMRPHVETYLRAHPSRFRKPALRVCVMASAAALLFAGGAQAAADNANAPMAPAPGWTQPYASLTEQPLRTVLQTFVDDHALQLVISPDFKSRIDHAPQVGALHADSAPTYLKQLTARFPFNWFVYENKLYISGIQDYRSARIGPLDGGLDQAHQALAAIGLLDPRFGWGELPDQSSVLVSGPSRYVELVRQMLRVGKPGAPQQTLMRFPLRYASVDDRQVQGCGSTSVVPGVASLLTKLITGTAPPFSGSSSLSLASGNAGGANLASGLGSGLGGGLGSGAGNSALPGYPQSFGNLTGAMGNTAYGNTLESTPMNLAAAVPPLPPQTPPVNLAADVRGNAILVRDVASRRPYYQALLDTLDVPASMMTIDLFSIEFDPSVQPLLDHLAAVACINGGCAANGAGQDRQLEFVAQLTALILAGKIEMVSRQRLITEDNQLVALKLERHYAGGESSGAVDTGGGGGGDGGGASGRDTGDQFCLKPHQIDSGAEPLIELMVSTSLHEPIGALGETPESYTQRQLNTVLTLRSGTPMLIETDTVVPKMTRQRAILLLIQPSSAGNAS